MTQNIETLTPWFSVDTPPVRVGWYDVEYDGEPGAIVTRMWYDGKEWQLGPDMGRSAFGNCNATRDTWRGLTSEAVTA
jgi:hypothetical protein